MNTRTKHTLTLAVIALATSGCGASSSSYMSPAQGPPPAPPGKAVLLFAADIEENGPSAVLTVWDENRRFLGQLFEHSMFAAEVTAGKHAFALIDLDRGMRSLTSDHEKLDCEKDPVVAVEQRSFSADVAPGKIYVVWVRWERPVGAGAGLGHNRFIFARPNAKMMKVTDVFANWRDRADGVGHLEGKKPFYRTADGAAGQTYLESFAARLCTPVGNASTPDLPSEFGFDSLPPH